MIEEKVHYATLEVSSLDDYDLRELNAYRNLGTLREFRRLKHEEMNRRERHERMHKTLEFLLGGAIFAATLVGIMFLLTL